MASLWMGDIDENMNEASISQAFQSMGESVLSVKIIRNRFTGELSGYCFVEFPSQDSAARCLVNVNGKLVPGANPPKRFKLKHALYTKPSDPSSASRNPNTEYLNAFNYYTQQFQQMFTNWKYDQKNNSYTYQQYGYTENSWPTSEELAEEDLEDPNPQVDVAEANKQFMEQSEELYDALMSCHWQPLDTVTSKIPNES
ncbi:tRNA selenocysteine 1-associated protein 1 [Bufo gargarizans]|uniref:tRNA selenocysteine 1-associated protein 1 n=1 Tax=Bufo gargarizans TaxID=30331 RepID=UPI001CF3A7E4|nr:tRNA selenocysteine 1-associated protein 1 [Bufo gargarizans]